MDANNTKYHLLHGERDWLPVLVNQLSNDLWWDRERKSISLSPIVQQLNELEQSELLTQEQKRGAAYDHYGNIYWINEKQNGVHYQPAATPPQHGQFWHIDELRRASQNDKNHGDFKPRQINESLIEPILSGLAVTTREYLLVGTLQPGGILVFDLHAGGPPDWLCWPEHIPFAPFDMGCAPGGGVWILDRDDTTGEACVWHLDQNFRVLDSNGEVVQLDSAFSSDFHAVDNPDTETSNKNWFYSGIALSLASPVLVANPIAIEALSDHSFIVLSTPEEGGASSVHYFNESELRDSVTLNEEAIGGLLTVPEIAGHDFAFLPDEDAPSHTVNGVLYISAVSATQSFEFAARASENQLKLVLQPKLLPMRVHNGKALIASANTAFYDFEERWLPLTEQPRYRYQSEAQIAGIIKDGAEPDCVWHRIIMDACIPPGTRVVVESRAANSQLILEEMPWQLEPEPYLRSDGSELPLHEPFADSEARPAYMGSWDFLLQHAVGRYIELRLTLLGNQRSTPRIRSLRIYYPRFSYLNRYLPTVYRQDQISASFLDRFLGNVEGLFTSMEDKIANAHMLFDTRSTPAEFLDWLGAWLGALMDPAWDDNRKRLFIDNATLLFRWRGTSLGLWTTIKLSISECPDATIFEPLKQEIPLYAGALSGGDLRIVENFLTRGFPEISPGDADHTTSLLLESSESAWEPAMGAGFLHQKYQRYLSVKYQAGDDIRALNDAWEEDYSQLGEILFPPLTPGEQTQQRDWQVFTRDFLGFTYADVGIEDLMLYQEFLARRYRQITRLNTAHGLLGNFMLTDFSEITLPDKLPQNTTVLSDWIEFVSLMLPIKEQAHQFTVLLPTVLGELPSAMELRKAQVEEIVKREKPAHTQFEVKFFWALFQIGSARLGIDTSIGEGSRFVALVLGANFLGQSFLAESHPWSVIDRTVVGRERLGKS
jgi:phage tail-like protein